ncbi:hypothetical protein Tco_1151506 [Tanacetum coccineum]
MMTIIGEPSEIYARSRYMRVIVTFVFHYVSTNRGHDIFMLVEKDYLMSRGLLTLMLCNKLQVDQYSEMANELLNKIFILANRPRQGGLLGIKGFYKFLLLVQLSTTKRRLSTAKLEVYSKEMKGAISAVASLQAESNSSRIRFSMHYQVPWSNERPLEKKELNAIIGAWFTLWRD